MLSTRYILSLLPVLTLLLTLSNHLVSTCISLPRVKFHPTQGACYSLLNGLTTESLLAGADRHTSDAAGCVHTDSTASAEEGGRG